MTKARTVGEKRHAKRGRPRKDGPREPSGRPSRIPLEQREQAQHVVAMARCKLMGWLPRWDGEKMSMAIPPDMMQRALADHMSCRAGRAIDGEPAEARAQLWGAIKLIGATYTRYWLSIGAPPPYAKAAMLTYLPEILGTDGVEASAWDDRSDEARVKGAAAAMMRIEQALGSVGAAHEVKGVVLMDEPVRDYGRFIGGLRKVLG